jgi:hypothetical protein
LKRLREVRRVTKDCSQNLMSPDDGGDGRFESLHIQLSSDKHDTLNMVGRWPVSLLA